MHEIHIRPAQLADAAAVAELAPSAEDMRQAAPMEMSPLDEEVVRQWMRERGGGFVLERDGEILAYGELHENSQQRDMYWIGHVMVRPSHRGSGFGRTLVGALLKHAVGHEGAREVRISAFADNPAAVRCYLACGFTEEGRRRIDGRTLVDLHYRDRNPERILPAIAAGLLAMGSTGVLAAIAPESFLEPLRTLGGEHPGITLAVAALSAGLFGLLLHPLLPRRRAARLQRLLLPVIYGAAVALSATAATTAVLFVLARLGWGLGGSLLDSGTGGLAVLRGGGAMSLILAAVSRTVPLGVLGGIVLAGTAMVLDRRRGLRS